MVVDDVQRSAVTRSLESAAARCVATVLRHRPECGKASRILLQIGPFPADPEQPRVMLCRACLQVGIDRLANIEAKIDAEVERLRARTDG